MKTFTRGNAIHVGSDEEFIVCLDVLSSGGYEWSVTEPSQGVAFLKASFDSGKQAPGAASVQKLHFRAKSPGVHRLQLDCKRPWDSSPSEHLSLTVQVT